MRGTETAAFGDDARLVFTTFVQYLYLTCKIHLQSRMFALLVSASAHSASNNQERGGRIKKKLI